MASVTIEGSGSWVGLARGQRETVALTPRIEKLIAKGFVVEVERSGDAPPPAAAKEAAVGDPAPVPPGEVDVEVDDGGLGAKLAAADETVDKPEVSAVKQPAKAEKGSAVADG